MSSVSVSDNGSSVTAFLEAGGPSSNQEVGRATQRPKAFPTVLFEPEGVILAPAAHSSFFVHNVFNMGRRGSVRVKFSGFNSGFRGWFIRGGPFVERSTGPITLQYARLEEAASDRAIIESVGGPERAVVGLAHVAALLVLDAQDEASGLLVDGRPNHFFVRRRSQRVTAIRLRKVTDGWRVGAFDTSMIEGFMDVWSEGRFFWRT